MGCSPADRSEPDGPVIARFADGAVTADELDARVLSLPPSERPLPGEDLDAWYREQIRELVVERRLLDDARERRASDDEELRRLAAEAERLSALELCLAELGSPEPVTAADVRSEYESQGDLLSVPERRRVHQIFLRRAPDARARLDRLRDRVLAGESFQRLATEQSESESRHRQGLVGWMVPGRLPAGFERVVFSLEAGVPSEPVATREGFHLFYVDQVLPAHRPTFEEVGRQLAERLRAERRDRALRQIDTRVEPPEGSLVMDRDRFVAALEAGDPQTPVVRLGDLSWTLDDVSRRVREVVEREGGAGGTVELAWQILDQARRREEIYQACRSEGHVAAEELDRRLGAWRERVLIDAERRRRLIGLASEDPDRLRLFYDSNLGEFSKPPTWTLRLLRIPLPESTDRAVALMARLEEAAAAGVGDLEALQAQLGGTLETTEALTLADIGRVNPKLPPLLAPLEVGQLAPPYRRDDELEIARVLAQTPAEPLPFAEVRQRVAARYVAQYTADLYDQLSERLLRDVDLEIDAEALAEVRAAGRSAPNVSVEELESLLDQMDQP